MKLNTLIKNFFNDESGAVTVDWVVLTAAIVGLGIAVLTTVGGSIETLAGDIEEKLGKVEVATQLGGAGGE